MKVPNKELREAFLRSGLNVNDVARFCGRFKKNGMPETTGINRALGLVPQVSKGRTYYNTHIQDETALKIIRALNLDPVDFRDIGL